MKWHLSQGLGEEQEDKGKHFKETLKYFKKEKKNLRGFTVEATRWWY